MNTHKQRDVLAEILARLTALERKVDEIRDPILRVATKTETLKAQAKRLGVHVNTLINRRRRERIRLMAEGKLKP